jgi:hypothetical protein
MAMTVRHAEASRAELRRDAVITVVAVLLAYAAFDDITTDTSATSFKVEQVALVLCAAALFSVCWNLMRRAYKGIGTISWVALIAGTLAGARIALGSRRLDEYLVVIAVLLWFVGLTVFLLVKSRRLTAPRLA